MILRLSNAIFLASYPFGRLGYASPSAIGLLLLAGVIALGLWTRAASTLAFAIAIVAALNEAFSVPSPFVACGLDALVLVACGPGAFSIDAQLFGRRKVHLPRVAQVDGDHRLL